jgi:hypothetical protein
MRHKRHKFKPQLTSNIPYQLGAGHPEPALEQRLGRAVPLAARREARELGRNCFAASAARVHESRDRLLVNTTLRAWKSPRLLDATVTARRDASSGLRSSWKHGGGARSERRSGGSRHGSCSARHSGETQ